MGRARKDTGKSSSHWSSGASEDGAITGARVRALMGRVAHVFARQQTQQMASTELLEAVNSSLVEGEQAFQDEEFEAGLRVMEARNKLLVAQESGEVMLVG